MAADHGGEDIPIASPCAPPRASPEWADFDFVEAADDHRCYAKRKAHERFPGKEVHIDRACDALSWCWRGVRARRDAKVAMAFIAGAAMACGSGGGLACFIVPVMINPPRRHSSSDSPRDEA